jgi:hypothetical protein
MRALRIIMGIFLPAIVATLIFGVSVAFRNWDGDLIESVFALLGSIIIFFIPAMLFVGIQSIIYAFVMEFMVNTFVKNDVIAVAISVLLGLLSALAFGSGVMMMMGALVGLIVGIMLRVMYLNTIGDDVKYWN